MFQVYDSMDLYGHFRPWIVEDPKVTILKNVLFQHSLVGVFRKLENHATPANTEVVGVTYVAAKLKLKQFM